MSVNKQLDDLLDDWNLFEPDEYVAKYNFKQSILSIIASEKELSELEATKLSIQLSCNTLIMIENGETTIGKEIKSLIKDVINLDKRIKDIEENK